MKFFIKEILPNQNQLRDNFGKEKLVKKNCMYHGWLMGAIIEEFSP